MSIRIVLFALVLGVITGCTPPKTELQANIEMAEDTLYGGDPSFRYDEALAQQAIDAYEAYAKYYPEDEKAADYLFKAADLYRAQKDYETAIGLYEKIEANYGEYAKVPHSLFLQGFVYENEIVDLDKAKAKYEQFLEKYPDHELADDVEFSLNNLGKTPEEIIKEFEQKQREALEQADTTAAEEAGV